MAAERYARGGLLVMLFILLLFNHYLQPADGCEENERRTLLAVKSDMYDPGGRFSSWTGDDCCSWKGVVCDNTTDGHVTQLDLHYPYADDDDDYIYEEAKGASKVNPSLFELKHLKYLDLSMNNFSGAGIPEAIASLFHLEYLNLSHAMFAGSIPPQLGNLSNLDFLDLGAASHRSMKCDDLHWLTRIPSLRYLDMSNVDLSRATAWLHQINSISTLQVLLLTYSVLPSPPSPLTPFNLTSITRLDLFNSVSLDDYFLRWLSNGSSLEYLYLGSCFSNPNMETLRVVLAALSNLKGLDLSNNNIHGKLSTILRNASRRLEYLLLAYNSLKGDFPETLGNITRLQHLDLSSNQIGGDIPPNMGNLVDLEFLDLSDNKIYGAIPRSFSNLYKLKQLYLSRNNISGQLPSMVGQCNLSILHLHYNNIDGELADLFDSLLSNCPRGAQLSSLNLRGNNLSGIIPSSLEYFSQLEELYLSSNSLQGAIPQAFRELNKLKVLDLKENQLSGQIPRMLGLCNLSILDLSHNNIGGEITDLLHDLSSNCPQGAQLSDLCLRRNNLSGTIPSSVGHFPQLEVLDPSSNLLQGNITEAHFVKLVNLEFLNISYNPLDVILPNDWHPPFGALTIDMSFCHLSGKLPDWIQTQSQLTQLYLSGVGLSGDLPNWFSDFISNGFHREVVLSLNKFSGLLPSTTTTIMDLSHNSFIGPIPSSFLNSTEAIVLSLSYNHINGTIPSSFCNATSLKVLDLSRNHLYGEIPSCDGSSPAFLKSLHLNDNELSGPLPSFLAQCKDLMTLDLGENKFYGEIPIWIGRNLSALRVLRLRSNALSGIIPANLSNLTLIQVLDLAFNGLHGSIPSSFGRFKSMVEIQDSASFNIKQCDFLLNRSCNVNYFFLTDYLGNNLYEDSVTIIAKGSTEDYTTILSLVTSMDLSNNNLSSKIPEELTNLLGLRFLSLANNHLIGSIPDDIGAMGQLESLDLSMNNLTGAIPPSLSALNYLAHLNLSYNDLSGKIPQGNQLQTFNDPTIFAGNKDLCGFPLKRGCPRDDASSHGGDDGEETGDKLETVVMYTFAVLGFVVGFWVFVGTIILKPSMRFALFRLVDMSCDWVYVQTAVNFTKKKPQT